MNENELVLIKQIINTPGFELVIALMDEEFSKKDINTKDRSYEDIAVEAMANNKLNEAYASFKNRLLSLNKIEKENIIYQ